MDTQKFAEWLAGMSTSEKIRALAMIYSRLTINTREFFLPNVMKGKEQVALHMLPRDKRNPSYPCELARRLRQRRNQSVSR